MNIFKETADIPSNRTEANVKSCRNEADRRSIRNETPVDCRVLLIRTGNKAEDENLAFTRDALGPVVKSVTVLDAKDSDAKKKNAPKGTTENGYAPKNCVPERTLLEYFAGERDAAGSGAYLCLTDAFFGPVFDARAFIEKMEAHKGDLVVGDPADPSALFLIRGALAEKENRNRILEKGIAAAAAELRAKGRDPFWLSGDRYLSGVSDPLHTLPLFLMEERAFPFVRKDLFYRPYGDVLAETSGESARNVLEYVEHSTSYDEDLIRKEIIAGQNMADIKNNLQLNYVLSDQYLRSRKHTIQKIALQLHLYYEDEAEFCKHYIQNMPDGTDIYITVPSEEKKEAAEKVFSDLPYKAEFRVIGNRGRDVSAFLVGMKDVIMDYDLVCSVHDKKVRQVQPMSIGRSWSYKCFENLLGGKIFVENIISLFEEQRYLGMLMPPLPVHGPYYPVLGKNEWGNNFSIAKNTAEMLGIQADIDSIKEPVAPLGTMFWVRPKALKVFFDHDWTYEDFPEEPLDVDATLLHGIERTYQFGVQHEGYYPAWVLSDRYAKIEMDNYRFMNTGLLREEMEKLGYQPFDRLLQNASKRFTPVPQKENGNEKEIDDNRDSDRTDPEPSKHDHGKKKRETA